MIDFEEAKQKQERGVTVKELLEDRLMKVDDMDSIVIISTNKDGTIETGFSLESSLESLGMLEVGKQTILNQMQE